MFESFSDVVNVNNIMEMLGIGKSKVYELLQNNTIRHLRYGNRYIIPKSSVIALFDNLSYDNEQSINSKLCRLNRKGA